MIICVVGPTGVGKTKLSIELAKEYEAIIINCDAMQVYQELTIGTAKIKESEKEGIPHYLFDFVDPSVNYTVADYQKDARKLLEQFKTRNIIFVGGTGLYLKAALYDYQFPVEKNLEKDPNERYSNEELKELCLKKDPNCQIHLHNRKRLLRFLKRKEESGEAKPLYSAIYIGLTTPREHLYSIIDKRVDKMMQEGLLEEVRDIYQKNIHSKALETGIGYKELYGYLSGVNSLEEAVSLIKKKTRHYAKRQYTFFNHQLPIHWLDVNYDHFEKTVTEAKKLCEKIKRDN